MIRFLFGCSIAGFAFIGALWVATVALGQQATPPCAEQLNNEMFQAGMLKQQLAVARAQLDAMTKERDEIKAKLPKVEEPAKK